ncbi:uncharacterized protein LOC126884223 [Diabrotica virgifera virgifera]|uniref:Uncharacterized protein LOC114340893 n=1 Tax=Diabrotica virgifera virgifera TaxID=50390 RepID=A0A6P7GDE5_DIAVI|nr:uncharacterized protein LOC126884223 [Diabrotica virgifera virgifera]
MKSFIVFTCVLVAAMASHLPNLPESERIKLAKVHADCQADPKTYVDEDKLRNLQNNINDHQVGVHMFCMAVKAGLLKSNGDLDIPAITSKVSLVVKDHSKVDGLVQKCAKKSDNSGKTANLLFVCFVQNDIQYYHKL